MTMKTNVSTEDAYLSDLLAYSLDRLGREPDLLRSESKRLEKQLQGIAIEHRDAFVAVEEGLVCMRDELEEAMKRLSDLAESSPKLEVACQEFVVKSELLQRESKQNRILLQNQGTVLDLLEIPSLMDTCIRNGSYDDALDLEVFASKLATVNSDSTVAKAIQREAIEIKQTMTITLLDKLKSSIQLPECLRVVGYLRRLGSYNETTLRLKFLACREAWLQEEVDRIGAEGFGVYELLKKLTDAHRVHLFDIVMQYRAIFSDDASIQDAEKVVGGSLYANKSDGGVLYSWGSHRVSSYLETLRCNLCRLTQGSDLASVLEHSMYCGMSLGRVGMDFRELLSPIFEHAAESLLKNGMQLAVDTFQISLSKHDWDPLLANAAAVTTGNTHSANQKVDASPPHELLQYPPLAVFIGAPSRSILSALNELRHCAFTSQVESFAQLLTNALCAAASALAKLHKGAGKNSPSVSACAVVFVNVAVPYVKLCYGKLFPDKGSDLIDSERATQPLRVIVTKAKRSAMQTKTKTSADMQK